MLLDRIAERWNDLLRKGPARTRVVGIYGLPRGGTNFIAAALHYHPQLFSVNEHVCDYRVPLRSIWRQGSLFRGHGRQDKRIDQIAAVVYNKMQEFSPELWNPRLAFPEGTRFVFYLRNPVRVHLSRESFRRKQRPERADWADTRQNFLTLLAETREVLEAHEILKRRHPCLVLTHEYFCCRHDEILPRLHKFLGVEPRPPANPREFLRSCGKCGRTFTFINRNGQACLVCPRHQSALTGCGLFNPLLPIDLKGVLDDSWRTTPSINRMMTDIREILGDAVADYFWESRYTDNLLAQGAVAAAA